MVTKNMIVTPEMIINAMKDTAWEKGNAVLYDLCMNKYPLHTEDGEIIAKVWLIGRSYAAAIERTKNNVDYVNDIYIDRVGPIMREDKELDNLLKNVGDELSSNTLCETIRIHSHVTDLFQQISDMRKRSLASKYLHFHKPNMFFIYDSRACKALRKFSINTVRVPNNAKPDSDLEYSKFAIKCFQLREDIHRNFKVLLTPRQIDNLFLYSDINDTSAS